MKFSNHWPRSEQRFGTLGYYGGFSVPDSANGKSAIVKMNLQGFLQEIQVILINLFVAVVLGW